MASGYPTSLEHLRERRPSLKFREDGTFRILHITDIHMVDAEMDDDEDRSVPVKKCEDTIAVIEGCIEKADPDLVVFGGDNISGYWEEYTYDYMVKTIDAITEPVRRRKLPLAVVFGNHDSEGEEVREFLRRENHITLYARYEGFLGCYNEEEVHGCGNCSLPVYGRDGSISHNIWLIDSNDYVRDENHLMVEGGGYDTVHPDQISWYEKKSALLREQNGGKPVPAILFQHIPVNQEYDLVEPCSENDEGAFESGGKFFRAKEGTLQDGVMREYPCPPGKDRAQFESWKRMGDVFAAFFGHDHVNTFTAEIDGIRLIQTVGAGYHSYGRERGGRLIVLSENSREFRTETIIIPKED